MLELLLILGLLIGVPALAIGVLAGSAAYVRAGAERELEAMAAEDAGVDEPDGEGGGQRSAETQRGIGRDEDA